MPLQPRHRPNLGNLAKDTTESELWAFDDLDTVSENPEARPASRASSNIPSPRQFLATDGPAAEFGSPVDGPASTSQRQWPTGDPGSPVFLENDPLGDFSDLGGSGKPDDLEKWQPSHKVAEVPPEAARIVSPVVGTESLPATSSASTFQDELNAAHKKGKENTPRRRLAMSKVEWIGLAVFLILLITTCGLIFQKTIGQLPTKSEFPENVEFPIKGKYLNVISAISYWREPHESGDKNGDKAEVIRNGTVLLPVLELTSSQAGEVRVTFLDDKGKTIGDIITRTVEAGTMTQISATAGFNDHGMHAAYRIGQTEPWKIEIREVSTEKSSKSKDEKLLEIPVSQDLR